MHEFFHCCDARRGCAVCGDCQGVRLELRRHTNPRSFKHHKLPPLMHELQSELAPECSEDIEALGIAVDVIFQSVVRMLLTLCPKQLVQCMLLDIQKSLKGPEFPTRFVTKPHSACSSISRLPLLRVILTGRFRQLEISAILLRVLSELLKMLLLNDPCKHLLEANTLINSKIVFGHLDAAYTLAKAH